MVWRVVTTTKMRRPIRVVSKCLRPAKMQCVSAESTAIFLNAWLTIFAPAECLGRALLSSYLCFHCSARRRGLLRHGWGHLVGHRHLVLAAVSALRFSKKCLSERCKIRYELRGVSRPVPWL